MGSHREQYVLRVYVIHSNCARLHNFVFFMMDCGGGVGGGGGSNYLGLESMS